MGNAREIGELMNVAIASCRDEYIDGAIYRGLSRAPFLSKISKSVLMEMASQEERHYRFWVRVSGGCRVRFLWVRVLVALFMALLFGATITIKILERKENETIQRYMGVLKHFEGSERVELEAIIEDEIKHENVLMEKIEEERIRYLGFIVLGLSDAIIEISGIHAGTLGVYEDTVKSGIAGLIAGIAASMAMAAAAYAQAKQGGMGRPATSAMYTGIAYFLTAVALAIPYFIVHEIIVAFTLSIAISIVILAYISTYGSVLYNRNYLREIAETTLIILGISAALYFIGVLVSEFLGIRV
ncbi:MAG: rubrerythrin family protein [Desulfurococcales archaeon]|nr:rubrerythrin family protein [Desulfurococcales archaeon]